MKRKTKKCHDLCTVMYILIWIWEERKNERKSDEKKTTEKRAHRCCIKNSKIWWLDLTEFIRSNCVLFGVWKLNRRKLVWWYFGRALVWTFPHHCDAIEITAKDIVFNWNLVKIQSTDMEKGIRTKHLLSLLANTARRIAKEIGKWYGILSTDVFIPFALQLLCVHEVYYPIFYSRFFHFTAIKLIFFFCCISSSSSTIIYSMCMCTHCAPRHI